MPATMKTPVSFRPRPAPEPESTRRVEVAPEGTRDLLRYAQRVIALMGSHAGACKDNCPRCEAFKDYERAKVRMQLWHTP